MYKFLRFPGFKYKAVTLSYDDDVVYDRRLVDIIDEYGLKCTFNINSELFAAKSGGRNLTKDEMTELLKNSPHEVAVHGAKHLSLGEFGTDVGTRDIIVDRENLEAQFGRIVKGMAYANGSVNDKAVEIIKTCGIKYARTTVSPHDFAVPSDWLRLPATCHHADPALNELTDKFLEAEESPVWYKNTPKLFYLWGHSYEFNDNNNWEIIENFAKRVGNREDVWYCTNGELYDYAKAYENLEYSANGKIIKNNSVIDVYLDLMGKKYVVHAGETVFRD